MKNYSIQYGKNTLQFSPLFFPPAKYRVEYIGASASAAGSTEGTDSILTEKERIRRALSDSIHLPKAAKSTSLLIIIPDQTRKCRLPVLLPLLLSECVAAGISRENITLLIAYGTHQPCSREETEALVGPEIAHNYRILHHNSRDEAELVSVGTTSRETDVHINKAVLEADAVVLIGGVQEHYFAGFGGGPKLLIPGCGGYETIRQNHALSINPKGKGLHPGCFEGNMRGNPVQEDIREAVSLVRSASKWGQNNADVTLQVVLDRKGQISFAAAGELYTAHDAACGEFVRRYSLSNNDKHIGSCDLVIAGCGGHPKDVSFIQAHKRLRQASRAVRKGGVIIFAAECCRGIGSETFLSMFEYGSIEEMHRALRGDYVLNGTTALSVKEITEKASVYLLSELNEQTVRKLGMAPVGSIDEAVELARDRLSPDADARCLVLDDGLVML